ncbi:MAG: DUF3899 domain-containing protein [Bacilli bacterium]|nr:DUF3899 domain-containing protein [Bacilli bacterium]
MRRNTRNREDFDLDKDSLAIKRTYWISFAITFVFAIAMAIGGYFIIRSSFGLSWEDNKWRLLTDAATFPGVFLILVYLLVKLSNGGAFDALSYSLQLVFYTVFFRSLRETKLPRSYTEYRLLKQGKKRAGFSYLLIVGGIFLLITVVFLILYYQLEYVKPAPIE